MSPRPCGYRGDPALRQRVQAARSRQLHRFRVSAVRAIADLGDTAETRPAHFAEANQYRKPDRNLKL